MIQVKQRIDPDNKNLRVYYSRFKMTAMVCMAEVGLGVTHADGSGGDSPFAEALLDIPGVEGLQLRPYSVKVIKAEAFDWEEIEPKLLALFAAFNADLDGSALTLEVAP